MPHRKVALQSRFSSLARRVVGYAGRCILLATKIILQSRVVMRVVMTQVTLPHPTSY